MNIDLNALHVFIALYKTSSTQRAAIKLGRSQSYVSKVLAQLREQLHDPLFVRTASGLAPTSYAHAIAPKVQTALEQLANALSPAAFSPNTLREIVIHIATPLIEPCGKSIIQTLRAHTQATIELRQWRTSSETGLAEETIDIGIHSIKERPQQLYQRKIITATAGLKGNLEGEMVKLIVDDYNEHNHMFRHQFGLDLPEPSILIDNIHLLEQLLDQHQAIGFLTQPPANAHLSIDVGFVCKATRKHEAKIQWLMQMLAPIIKQLASQ
ncbi:LysR family transcriptional regulator [Motilimonas eburnea]|uniref:LysR family transcriptional regulator n=1 Tax=Motilimonas eburnea TaxID=1737488 RepID=UPI001E5A0FE9|nr:LysR family transcriptional regulator [Motilimonas eburnea]MCE2573463.1 LysR family transcriptional regulator [Motilimonas eburnea]